MIKIGKQYLAEYLRLSIEDGDKMESNSITHQRALIEAFKIRKELNMECKSMEFMDDGYSGTNFDRPALKRLFTMVKNREIKCIIVKDISRFGRNYLEVGDYLEQIFPFMGVRFISINDHYDSNAHIGTTGGMEVAFKSLMYDMYSKDLSVKMCSALEIRRRRGDYIGPRPPFGYIFSKNKRELAVDPKAAQHIQYIFSLAAIGYSTGKIAKILNEKGIPTPGKYKNQIKETYSICDGTGFWNGKMVLTILQNKVYLGIIESIGGCQFKHIYSQKKHEAIITEQQFANAANIVANRGSQKYKRHRGRRKYILHGKLRCGECHRCLHRIDCTTIPYFKCAKTDFMQPCSCPVLQLQEPDMDIIVKKCLQLEILKIGYINDYVNGNNFQKEMEKLLHISTKVRSEKYFLYEKYKSKQINQEMYLEKAERIREKEIKINIAIEKLKDNAEKANMIKELAPNAREEIELTRDLVDSLIDKVNVYDKDRLEIVWKFRSAMKH